MVFGTGAMPNSNNPDALLLARLAKKDDSAAGPQQGSQSQQPNMPNFQLAGGPEIPNFNRIGIPPEVTTAAAQSAGRAEPAPKACRASDLGSMKLSGDPVMDFGINLRDDQEMVAALAKDGHLFGKELELLTA